MHQERARCDVAAFHHHSGTLRSGSPESGNSGILLVCWIPGSRLRRAPE
jgi:hypothetical protein